MSTAKTAALLAKLRSSKRLPSPPGTALRVLELCRNQDADIKEIAEVIMADPALAGRLLWYANSALLGAGREVVSVRDAVLCLGLRTVKLTALGFSLASGLESSCSRFALKRLWTESVLTAILARRFAPHFDADREEAFTAGLLSGIGRLALACGAPKEYAAVETEAPADCAARVAAERDHLGTDHLEFGGELLTHWAVPQRLVQAVRHQLRPEQAERTALPLAQTIHVAVRLAPLFLREADLPAELRRAARQAVESRLKLSQEAWQHAAEETLADYRQVAAVFDVELDQAAVFDLYAEAQEEATRVGIVAQLEKSRALEENKDLLKRATTDYLTGAANRARFDERLRELLAGAARGHGDFAIVLLDIDQFKELNDAHGHAAGDVVLQRVAQTVRGTLREVDLLARYGGDEFVILAPRTDQRGACIIAARTRKCVENLNIAADGPTFHVTVSIGLALSADYDEVPTAEQLIAEADRQLYVSKKAGRNTWSYRSRSAAYFAQPAPSR